MSDFKTVGEKVVGDFGTVDMPVVEINDITVEEKGLIIDERNKVICKKTDAVILATVCKECPEFDGFDFTGDYYIVGCKYEKKTIKQLIIEVIQNAPDYHPNHLDALADTIIKIVKEDK